MMIDISSETVLSFEEARRVLPARRRGKRPHVATLYRWADSGCRGVVLETLQVGGTRCTSVEALQRFFNRLGGGASTPPPVQRFCSIGAVDRQLEKEGL